MSNLLLINLAVWFIGFEKSPEIEVKKSGARNLFAFFLANLATTALFVGFIFVSPVKHQPVRVEIRSNLDVHNVVDAIRSLHRNDVSIRTIKDPLSNWVKLLFGGALGFMFLTGVVMAFYKVICRWMKIPPVI